MLAGALWFLADTLWTGEAASTAFEASGDVTLLDGTGPTLAATGGSLEPEKAEAESEPATPDDALDAEALEGIVLEGRVVDERRQPIAEASIEARMGRREPVMATSDAEGRFVIPVGDFEEGRAFGQVYVFATAPGPLAGMVVRTLWGSSPSNRVVLEPLVLGKGQRLEVQVNHLNVPLAGAPVSVIPQSGWYRGASLRSGVTDERGRYVIPLMPPTPLTVVAAGVEPGQGRKATNVRMPRNDPSEPVHLDVGTERVLDVLVVMKEDGTPVPGAKVIVGDSYTPLPPRGVGYLPELPDAVTDDSGRVQIRGLGEGTRLTVSALVEGYPRTLWGGRVNATRVPKNASEAQIELQPFRTVKFHIAAGEIPIPSDDTPLEVKLAGWWGRMQSADEGPTARIEDGHVIAEGLAPGWVRGSFRAPDGSFAPFRVQHGKDEGPSVTFVKRDPLRVRVTRKDGSPATGVRVVLAMRRDPNQATEPIEIDAEGLGTFEPVAFDDGDVRLIEKGNSNLWEARVVGQPSLKDVSEVFEISLADTRELAVQVLLAGKPALPRKYQLRVGTKRLKTTDLIEEPDTGTLRAHIEPWEEDAKAPTLQLTGEGYLPASHTLTREELEGGGPITLELAETCKLVCRYTPPEEGSHQLVVQRYDLETDRWKSYNASGWAKPPEKKEKHVQHFGGLEPGRYRAFESNAKLGSEAVDLVRGAPPMDVFLDLSVLTWVRGRVGVPNGHDVRKAAVQVLQPGQAPPPWGGTNVKRDGSFAVRAVRGQPVLLRATHPVLAAAGGLTRARGGDERVRLKLHETNSVVFRVPALTANRGHGASGSMNEMMRHRFRGRAQVQVMVRLYRGALSDAPVKMSWVQPDGQGVFRIGGVEPGTYTIWFEAQQSAHTVRQAVAVGKGEVDLGVIQLPEGSRLRFFVRSRSGKTLPRYWVQCRRLDAPSYWRNGGGVPKAGAPLIVKGLGTGRWSVVVRPQSGWSPGGGPPPIYEQELDLDGHSEQDISIDVK